MVSQVTAIGVLGETDRGLTVLRRPFADAIRAGVGSVMCSYNRINATYACENGYTNYLLKHELEFQGFGE